MKSSYSFILRGCALAAAAIMLVISSGFQNLAAGEPESGKGGPAAAEDYVGGRGLLTLTGPTGLFINPTSGTMDQGEITMQYCFYLPAGSTFSPSGHGWIGSYGITDSLEVGFTSLFVNGPDDFSVGPMARYRLSKDEGMMPEVSLVGYSRFGDDVDSIFRFLPRTSASADC